MTDKRGYGRLLQVLTLSQKSYAHFFFCSISVLCGITKGQSGSGDCSHSCLSLLKKLSVKKKTKEELNVVVCRIFMRSHESFNVAYPLGDRM